MKKRFFDGEKKDTIIGLSKLDLATLDILSEETGYSKSALISAAILMVTRQPEEFADAMNTKKESRSNKELVFSFVRCDGSHRNFYIQRWLDFYKKVSNEISSFDVQKGKDVSDVNQKDIDATKVLIKSKS